MSRDQNDRGTDRDISFAAWSGAWAKPLRAWKFHFFRDGSIRCLCAAYATQQVKPSEFGTGQPDDERCPTCERKLHYLIEATRAR